MLSKIFISYARTDESFARQLATRLSAVGAKIWLDVKDIPLGMNWGTAIQQGLDESDLMLLIVSAESMNSENVTNEWQYFLDEKKPIIPVLLKPAKRHFQLQRMQYVDFQSHSFDDAFKLLQTELRRKGMQVKPLASDTPSFGQPRLIQDVAADVEKALGSIGIDAAKARFNLENKGNYGWSLKRGSAIVEVYVSSQEDTSYFQVLSPLLEMPPENMRFPLYQRLLELNLQLTGAALGIYLDVIYLFFEQSLEGLTLTRIQNTITQIAAYADDLDNKLVAEFGGKLYSSIKSSE